MYKVSNARMLVDKIYAMDVEAPRVVAHCQPGQFVIVKVDEQGERIPLTICDYDRTKGTVTLVYQTVGTTTFKLSELKDGDELCDITGPLGRPSDLIDTPVADLKKMNILFVAGGVGAAPVYPQAKWLKEHGGDIYRNKNVSSMLATVINALAIQSALETAGVETRVQTAIDM